MIMAPPGVPADRVQALRRAFDATMKDPEFIAELKTSRVELGPMAGEELQKLVIDLGATAPALVDKIKAVYPLN
jgi:tripartite-type tricarboxylate transporter receptor subunit TctC